MEQNQNRGPARYADRPVNEAQARLWRQQTRPAAQTQWPVTYTRPAVARERVGNPWIDNLPCPAPRAKKSGLAIFLLLIALLLLCSFAYWQIAGLPDRGGAADGSISASDVQSDTIRIATVSGGGTRVKICPAGGEKLTAQEIYQKVNPAVVAVVTALDDDSGAVGTGVIISEDGYLLTNAHVIEDGVSCTVLLADNRRYEAKLVGYDTKRDVAVLKAVGAAGLPTVELGDSTALVEGDRVYAIGNPLGLELRGTITDGIVSAVNRRVRVNGRTMTLIQTNAAINQGNSGGPLINEYGQVVGLNVVKMSARSGETVVEGLGFAVPSETVEYLANQILEYGAPLPDTSLGISVYAVGNADSAVRGLMVAEVTEGSCAQRSGVREGDVILSADGQQTLETADLLAVRRSHAPGETITLTLRRGSEKLTLPVVLDEADDT